MLEERIRHQYDNCDNYKIIDISNKRTCIIYCSSNGLWDWSEESFAEMADQDKNEWESLDRHDKLHSCFGKAIFIRDIQQHFYVDGINHVIDSTDRIIEVLQPIVEGYEITTVGTSSGGYLAMLLGSVLNAKRAFSFCGQIDLSIWGVETITFHFPTSNHYIVVRIFQNIINGLLLLLSFQVQLARCFTSMRVKTRRMLDRLCLL